MKDPPTADQKRKRGRPTNALRDNEVIDMPTSPTTAQRKNKADKDGKNQDTTMNERPSRKRGRPAKGHVSQELQPEISQVKPTQRQRREPSPTQASHVSTALPPSNRSAAEVGKAKRGRPKKGQGAKPPEPAPEEADDEGEDEGNSSLLRRSKRNRRSSEDQRTSVPRDAAPGVETSSEAGQRTAKRKRPDHPEDTEQPDAHLGDEVASTSQPPKRRRGRKPRSSQDPQPSIDEPTPEPDVARPNRKQGRPSKSDNRDAKAGTGTQSSSSQNQGKPAHKGLSPVTERRRSSATGRKSKERKPSSAGQDQSPAHPSSSDSDSDFPPYRHLTERTRRVTHETIESKWDSLDASSVANIGGLLHSVSLPTLHHVIPKQYAHAEEVLGLVVRGLCKRMAKVPFPPASTLQRCEDELDFERTQSAIDILTSQLDPLQHSVELLKREKERVEKTLERDYKVLDRLSTNARAEARERRDRLRKVHVLVPTTTYESVADNIEFLSADKATNQVFASVQDEELLGLAGQINNHMESMRGNLQQIDGVLPAIAKSQALLKTTLHPQLDQKQLENIILG
ncbi:CENP-Q, a CENPA-CAD centromere complex subunit-domain-containing protein [Astrocystis sublimbata]|nr:CENP-Q, a CENPA-CAD centromere complex subunit-domain-containing protein [Astrocystis sublimbata]